MQSTTESGARGGESGAKRREGSKVYIAVDTLGHLLALTVTAARADERTQVATLASEVHEVTGQHVEIASVEGGYDGVLSGIIPLRCWPMIGISPSTGGGRAQFAQASTYCRE